MNRWLVGWLLLAAWVLCGAAIGLRTARRGHDPRAWIPLGIVAGPFTWGLWRASCARHPAVRPRLLAAGATHPNPVGALVGIDGSAEASAAVAAVAGLFGDRLGRLVIATVLDYDTALEDMARHDTAHDDTALHDIALEATATSTTGATAAVGAPTGPQRLRAAACEALQQAARRATAPGVPEPELVLLAGRPAEALQAYALEQRLDVLAVGGRGRGLSKALLGSTAAALSARTEVPLLIVPSRRRGARSTTLASPVPRRLTPADEPRPVGRPPSGRGR